MTTIHDIAKAVGISSKTVSRVLNNETPVKKETREAVERAMADLGYVPSSAARALRSQRSGLVGLITGGITDIDGDEPSGLPEIFIVRGIQSVIRDSNMTSLITDTGGVAGKVPHLIRTLLEHRVEGILYVGSVHCEVTLPSVPGGSNLVLANCFDQNGTPAFVPDDRNGQKALVTKLIDAGHRRIAYLTLNEELVATKLRVAGYKAALKAAGIVFDPALLRPGELTDNDQTRALLNDTIDELLALPSPPTVLCCGNDKMALRVYGVLRTRGLSIPKDVSVAGYDNYGLIADQLYPSLTTVELPYVALGAQAAKHLLALIQGDSPQLKKPVRLPSPVRWRESVTVLPAKGRNSRAKKVDMDGNPVMESSRRSTAKKSNTPNSKSHIGGTLKRRKRA